MKEFIYSRNAVYEKLRAKRRIVFKIQVAEGAQEKGHLKEILDLAKVRKFQAERVACERLDKVHKNYQGVMADVSEYPYRELIDILDHAKELSEPPFILLLDTLNDPWIFMRRDHRFSTTMTAE